jgi:hypothetical protein
VYRALKYGQTKPGDWVVIPGAGGGLGHLGLRRPCHFNYPISHEDYVSQLFSMQYTHSGCESLLSVRHSSFNPLGPFLTPVLLRYWGRKATIMLRAWI